MPWDLTHRGADGRGERVIRKNEASAGLYGPRHGGEFKPRQGSMGGRGHGVGLGSRSSGDSPSYLKTRWATVDSRFK
jgi:hypothetical protein